tara:strand:+ start:247 stop:732 length:486 start_codon:yes stop_codon:yes gene_type:complete
MIHWIFDIDDTIYQLRYRKQFFDYRDIKYDPYLKFLIKKLPGPKHIFSNSMLVHTNKILTRQKMTDIFHNKKIYTRDRMGSIKPSIHAYKHVIKNIKPKKKDKLVFFDDRVENLWAAKRHGWVTVSISPNSRSKYPFVDLSFPNIHAALEFFLSIKNKNRR